MAATSLGRIWGLTENRTPGDGDGDGDAGDGRAASKPAGSLRILALEPDRERGRRLMELVRNRVDAEVIVVASGNAAIAAISLRAPDLIVTSSLFPPGDEALLLSHLKQMGAGFEPPSVITVPPLLDLAAAQAGRFQIRRGCLELVRGRSTSAWPPYDIEAIGSRIQDALEEARTRRSLRVLAARGLRRGNPGQGPNAGFVAPLSKVAGAGHQMRARRWTPAELPWLCSIRTSWGSEPRVVNISTTGVLVESPSKLGPDSSLELRLTRATKAVAVTARVVRSEVASVNSMGVRYHAAAVFGGTVDLLPAEEVPEPPRANPQALARLLARATDGLVSGRNDAAARATFERGLRELTRVREVRLRDAPAPHAEGTESIYFTVPGAGDAGGVLQVVFDANHLVTAEEFKLLKVAAAVAGFQFS